MRPPDAVSPIRRVWSPTGHRITAHLLSHDGHLLFQSSHGSGSLLLALKPQNKPKFVFQVNCEQFLMFFLDKAIGSFGAWSEKIVLLCAVGERVEWDRNLSLSKLGWKKRKKKDSAHLRAFSTRERRENEQVWRTKVPTSSFVIFIPLHWKWKDDYYFLKNSTELLLCDCSLKEEDRWKENTATALCIPVVRLNRWLSIKSRRCPGKPGHLVIMDYMEIHLEAWQGFSTAQRGIDS